MKKLGVPAAGGVGPSKSEGNIPNWLAALKANLRRGGRAGQHRRPVVGANFR